MKNREQVRDALLAELRPISNPGRVVLLTGPWGCGKTFLWREIRSQLDPDRIVYLSLFGEESIAGTKTSLMNASLLRKIDAARQRQLRKAVKGAGRLLARLVERLVAKGIDAALGTEILSRNLDPLRFVDEHLIVCLDDVERISSRVQLVEVLGLTSILAENLRANVLIIMNQEHLENRSDDAKRQFDSYREKVVSRIVKVEADIASCYDLFLRAYEHRPATKQFLSANKTALVHLFETSAVANLRTLQKVMNAVSQFVEAEVGFVGKHLVTLAAIVMDSAEHPRARRFYEFDGTGFLFGLEPDDECRKEQSSFYRRYIAAVGADYCVIFEFPRLIDCGFFDRDAAQAQLNPKPLARSPGQELVDEAHNEDWFFYGDAQYSDWIQRVRTAITEDPNVCMTDLMALTAYVHVAAARANLSLPAQFTDAVVAAAKRRAELGDESFDEERRMWLAEARAHWEPVWNEASAIVKANGLKRLVAQIRTAIAERDRPELARLVVRNPEALLALLSPEILDELTQIRNAAPAFAYRSLGLAAKELTAYRSSNIIADVEQRIVAFDNHLAGLERSASDNAERRRFATLRANLKTAERQG